MEYIVLVNGKEYGPIEQKTLVAWVEAGRIMHGTSVRNTLIDVWKKAGAYDFLSEAFETQNINFGLNKTTFNSANTIEDDSLNENKEETLNIEENDNKTSYENPFYPDPANILQRFLAFIFDYVLLILIIGFILALFISLQNSLNLSVNFLFYLFFSISFFIIIIYFTACFGVFAQTVGMLFWGIIIVRKGDDARPVYLLRAMFYTIFMLVFGIISPVFIFTYGKNRSLHDVLTGIQVVKTSARSK